MLLTHFSPLQLDHPTSLPSTLHSPPHTSLTPSHPLPSPHSLHHPSPLNHHPLLHTYHPPLLTHHPHLLIHDPPFFSHYDCTTHFLTLDAFPHSTSHQPPPQSYSNSPELRQTWLDSMATLHLKYGNYSEVCDDVIMM